MDVFGLRNRLIDEYRSYVSSFLSVKDDRIRAEVDAGFTQGLLWPDPMIQLNPSFEQGGTIDDLVAEGLLHQECSRIFRIKPQPDDPGKPLRLHKHQTDAIRTARTGQSYVLTTGTGSGKSLAYIIPIVDSILRRGPSLPSIQAIVVYPMNALANSQEGELRKFLCHGYPDGKGPVTFRRYTGQERDPEKTAIIADPPHILLTNYVMLELLLTRPQELPLIRAAEGLRFLVLDELHTYRGRQGADVAMLVRRARDAFRAPDLQCVGTSATLAGPGTLEEQRAEVARVGTLLFGATIHPDSVIGETLRRATPERDPKDAAFIVELQRRIEAPTTPTDYAGFLRDPLSSWIETTFGVTRDPASNRLVRTQPRTLQGPGAAAEQLASLTGLPADRSAETIEKHLLASYVHGKDPETGFPIFAFRLHQFISRGDNVYASVEPESVRHITLRGQPFAPGDRNRPLFPVMFCRECGQEYYSVRLRERSGEPKRFIPRPTSDVLRSEEGEAGYLYLSTIDPWPSDAAAVLQRIPGEWIEETDRGPRIRSNRRAQLPRPVRVGPDAQEDPQGTDAHYLPAPFRFCLSCDVSYGARGKDYARLATLATEGRATATTILAGTTVRQLRLEESLKPEARKLLSFTDNRQDASLQAGHFNDFVEVGLLRSALYRAALKAAEMGLRHDELVLKVFEALALPFEHYAADPTVRFQAREDTERAFRQVLGYRLYRDLERGWRVTLPNLEQCGLLQIGYGSLDDLCGAEDVWGSLDAGGGHQALVQASPNVRREIARTLLGHMRQHLAIKVDYLQGPQQESIKQQSAQRLRPPWGMDENERMETASILHPRSVRPIGDSGGHIFLSGRSAYGQYLRRPGTFPGFNGRLSVADSEQIIRQLLRALRIAGIVEEVHPARDDDPPGYQLLAAALIWSVGDGTRAFHDPIRVPRAPSMGGRTNPFFIRYYQTIAGEGIGLEAREHTAQVNSVLRQEREEKFREGRLPILFCSPTMELGVDIKDLNAVNLRNMPPTPANYAQRSGRAGRSGQPAFVYTYCSTYSSHDQYFFRRPTRMVGGAVAPPRIDLANEDLLRAHIQAIWMATTGLYLGTSLREILDFSGDRPSLGLLDRVGDSINDPKARVRARERAVPILEALAPTLEGAEWFTEHWLDEVLGQAPLQFERSCERWRGLYRAARQQQEGQTAIILDASRNPSEKDRARRLRAEAEAQIELLTDARNLTEGDFYSYRYFASEGFLPGYSFPRLPLSAYIPGRRIQGQAKDEFLNRPRFLAISEFGPRAIVYHEGARYRINKVILPTERTEDQELVVTAMKQCTACGYLHHSQDASGGPDLCERCDTPLAAPLRDLFRLQNVSTKRADRISADEEERMRIGYEIRTGFRFARHGEALSSRTAQVLDDGEELAKLTYAPAATLSRINMGWARRANRNQFGFVLDTERGYWASNNDDVDDEGDPLSNRNRRVIPYVEDHRNALLLEPSRDLTDREMASLGAALENGIEVEFQLEDTELAVEPLPSPDNRHLLLFYEAAEGGAGVLRRLLDDASALSRVARQALEICHYDPETGEDRAAPGQSSDPCEAACYDCLMSYTNQSDHRLLDRAVVRDLLLSLARAKVEVSPGSISRPEHLALLKRMCESGLERTWLDFLERHDLHLPSHAQRRIDECNTRPDFLYADAHVAIYVDGDHHKYPDRLERDKEVTERMRDAGYTVIRFPGDEDWSGIIREHPNLFGRLS